MSTPATGNREFRDDVVRIAALTVREPRIEGYTFVNCRIVGPAVLALVEGVEMSHCSFEGDVSAIFWEIDPLERPVVFGPVGLTNCVFSACRFEGIGFAGTAELRTMFERALSSD